MRNNQQAVILKVYVSAMFLLLSTIAVAIDKEMVTVALAVTVTDDPANVSQKNIIENGHTRHHSRIKCKFCNIQ